MTRKTAILIVLLAWSAATACQPAPTSSPTAVPPTLTFTTTPTPAPTSTPTPTPVPTSTPSPTATATVHVRLGDALPTRVRPTPTPTPAGLACTVTVETLNLRAGPGTGYPVLATLPRDADLTAWAQVEGANWVMVSGESGLGWVYAPALACRQNPATLPTADVAVRYAGATAQPTPQPTPSSPALPSGPALSTDYWLGEYFDNPSLQGPPMLVRQDPAELNFNWILNSPAAGIPADNFSVRWRKLVDFLDGGDYRLFAEADDGVRVYVDDRLVINNWDLAAPVTYQGGVHDLPPGLHTVTVEYFESGGLARVKVWGDRTELEDERWLGEYFANGEWAGEPVFTREDEEIDFDWGHGSPGSRLPDNDFSVRWRRKLFFDKAGDVRFTAEVDKKDRVRILLDGWLLVDKTTDESGPVEGYFSRLQPGFHTITVKYQDPGKGARIRFDWARQ